MRKGAMIRNGLAAGLLFAAAGGAYADIIYVDSGALLVTGNGSSWASPFFSLQDALAAAQPGDELWVKAGTYIPDRTAATPFGTGNRDASFGMKFGVEVYGGFNGTETARSQRDPEANPTVLSGELGIVAAGQPPVMTDNSRSVVTAFNVTESVLDGFTITRGYCSDGSSATQDQTAMGAGLFAYGGAPVVRNCRFVDNSARGGAGIGAIASQLTVQDCEFLNGFGDSRGGAIDMWACPNIVIEDSRFQGNVAYFGGAVNGNNATSGRVTRCVFVQNISVNGGAMWWGGFSNPVVSRTLFLKNECKQLSFYQASFNGGACVNWCANVRYVNCIFNANYADGSGAAMYDGGPSGTSSETVNCLFYNNVARSQGGVCAASGQHTPRIRNSIFRDNPGNHGWAGLSGSFDMLHTGNTVLQFGNTPDPQFVDPDGPDNIAGTEDDDFRLGQFASFYIDTGINEELPLGTETDYAGNIRVVDGNFDSAAVVDIGPFEARSTPFFAPCEGDANGDRVVDFNDITSVLGNWLTEGPEGDANGDDAVDFNDITAVLANWLAACP